MSDNQKKTGGKLDSQPATCEGEERKALLEEVATCLSTLSPDEIKIIDALISRIKNANAGLK